MVKVCHSGRNTRDTDDGICCHKHRFHGGDSFSLGEETYETLMLASSVQLLHSLERVLHRVRNVYDILGDGCYAANLTQNFKICISHLSEFHKCV